jgi:hypothetical protein
MSMSRSNNANPLLVQEEEEAWHMREMKAIRVVSGGGARYGSESGNGYGSNRILGSFVEDGSECEYEDGEDGVL